MIVLVKIEVNVCDLQPTGENGATRAPICIDLQRDTSLSSKSIIIQIDNKSQQVSASQFLLLTKVSDLFDSRIFSFSNESIHVLCFVFRSGFKTFVAGQIEQGLHGQESGSNTFEATH